MQIVIELNERTLRRAAFCIAALGITASLLAPRFAQAGAVTIPNTFTSGTAISASQMNANFAAMKAEIDDNDARIAALETLLAGVTRSGSNIVLTGLNLNVRNGLTATSSIDGTGNLIIGHNENLGARTRTGSHNLVIGGEHGYTSSGGVISGAGHQVAAPCAVALGGQSNTVEGDFAVAIGGVGGTIEKTPTSGEEGTSVVFVGCHGAQESIDRLVNVGGGASEAVFGGDADFAGFGFGTGLVAVGDGATNVFLGRGATNSVLVGGNAGGFFPGAPQQIHIDAATVNMGANAATASVNVGGTSIGIGGAATTSLFLNGAGIGVGSAATTNTLVSGGIVTVGGGAATSSVNLDGAFVGIGTAVTTNVAVNGTNVNVGDAATPSSFVVESTGIDLGTTATQAINMNGQFFLGDFRSGATLRAGNASQAGVPNQGRLNLIGSNEVMLHAEDKTPDTPGAALLLD